MDFSLTEEQKQIQEMARDFARNEILPLAAECDLQSRFPTEVVDKARDLQLMELCVPEELGGPGLSTLDASLINEELGWACTGIGSALTINNLVLDALLLGGSDEQKARWVERLRKGFGAYALTEPGAGSDAAAITTRAEKKGDVYLMSGRKTWITNAAVADFFVVFAKTDPQAGHRGISAFLVERNASGVDVSNPLPKLGQKAAPACEIGFDQVEIPEANRLGPEGAGFTLAMKVFDRSRPMVAASAVGLAQRCLDEARQYALQRKAFGRSILEFQGIGFKLADMAMKVQASRLLTRQAAWMVEHGVRSTLESACAKAFAADSCMETAIEAVQVLGGYGYSQEYPVEKLMRDAKVMQIYEGTSEIQRTIIVRELSRM